MHISPWVEAQTFAYQSEQKELLERFLNDAKTVQCAQCESVFFVSDLVSTGLTRRYEVGSPSNRVRLRLILSPCLSCGFTLYLGEYDLNRVTYRGDPDEVDKLYSAIGESLENALVSLFDDCSWPCPHENVETYLEAVLADIEEEIGSELSG